MNWRGIGKGAIVGGLLLFSCWLFRADAPPLQREVRRLADNVSRLEEEMNAVKAMVIQIMSLLPVDGKLPQPAKDLQVTRAKGLRFEEGSCLWRLADAVKDCRVRNEVTNSDKALIESLQKECLSGL